MPVLEYCASTQGYLSINSDKEQFKRFLRKVKTKSIIRLTILTLDCPRILVTESKN